MIYKATNTINNKCYIGQSIKYETRKLAHIKSSSVISPMTYFSKALKKYSVNNFEWEILVKCPQIDLNEQEIYWIKYWNSFGKGGYNLTIGGDTSYEYKHTDATKQKISETRLRKNFKGHYKHTEKTKLLISKIHKNKKVSKESKYKMSIAKQGVKGPMYGKTGEKHPNYGIKLSKETKDKISKNHSRHNLGKKLSKEIRKKMSINTSGIKNHNYDKTIYHFYHSKYKNFIGTQYEFKHKYNLNNLHLLIKNKTKSIKGWVFKGIK